MKAGKQIALVGYLFALAIPNVIAFESEQKQAANSAQRDFGQGAAAEIAEDAKVLQAIGVGTDDAGLLGFIKKHSPRSVDPSKLKKLIRQLGSENFGDRQQAARALVAEGPSALVYLRKALNDSDLEVARRAQACTVAIRKQFPGLPVEAVRVLVYRRPAGAVEALLGYLPLAAEDSLEEEVWYGLDALVTGSTQTDPALVAVLKDESPSRRAVAACLLGRKEGEARRAAVRKLLLDPEPMVRLRAAQGLLTGRDKSGIPALIGLLNDPSIEIAWQAEELLHWAAGQGAPREVVGPGEAKVRLRCQAVWLRWWQAQKEQLNLNQPQLFHKLPGLLLISESKARIGRVWLCGCDGMCRWQIDTFARACDVQMLPNGHFLLAEGRASCFTERNLEGNVVWQERVGRSWASRVRRHANTTTFLESTRSVWRKTLDGREICRRDLYLEPPKALHSIEGARVLPNGNIAFIGSDPPRDEERFIQEMDPASGKILHRVPLKQRGRYIQGSETWVDGHFLLAWAGQIVEVNRFGTAFSWMERLAVPMIDCAVRIRTGTIVLAGRDDDGWCVKELNREGVVQWELPCEDRPATVQDLFPMVRLGFNHEKPKNWNYNSVAICVSRLTNHSSSVRRRAIAVLQKAGPHAAEATEALINTFYHCNDLTERHEIISALVAVGSKAVLPLAAALRDKRAKVRLGAADALANLGSAVNPAVPALVMALKDENWQVRRSAAEALGKSTEKPEVAARALLVSLTDQDKAVVNTARYSLSRLNPKNAKVVMLLQKSSKNENWEIRRAAAEALESAGSDSGDVVASLTSLLEDKKTEVVIAAASSLGRRGSKKAFRF